MTRFGQTVVPLAVALDLAFGEPPRMIHPVVWMGKAISFCERLAPARGRQEQFVAGLAMAVGIPSAFAAMVWAVEARTRATPWIFLVFSVVTLKATFALRALGAAARSVRDDLVGGRIDDARAGLASLCSRDASGLSPEDIAAAAIESIAENASDSFVAPLFWFALLGLPGAVFYRASNTLDAMIGYRGRYEWLGKVAARVDDGLNWIPARLTAGLLLAAGGCMNLNVRRGVRILSRDGGATESPNAGRPMATMAGLLGVALSKAGQYRLGDAIVPVDPSQIDRAWRVIRFAALFGVLLFTIAGAIEARFVAR